MITRREWLGQSVRAGAALALTSPLLRALEMTGGKLIQRAIPSTGEMLPVISFGPRPTGAAIPGVPFQPQPTDVPAAKEVLEAFIGSGGRVVDVLHGGPIGEQAARTAAGELGVQDKLFWTTPLSVPPVNVGPVLPGVARKVDPAAVRAAMEEKLAKFSVPAIDLVMVGAGSNAPTYLAVLREMKKEGRVRYVGVHELIPPGSPEALYDGLEAIMRNEQIDFVGTDYAVGWRGVEEKILPLAVERKIAFMAYFPFDRSRMLERVSGTSLPEWAAEFDAKTWAQFCLKYVLGHPAVIVARTGTTKGAHMLENVGGGIGRLPDEALRKRMAAFVDSLPLPPEPPASPPPPGVITEEQVRQARAEQRPAVALSAAVLDRYVGEYQHVAVGTLVTIRRDGETLLLRVHGDDPDECPFVALSETRFASAPTLTLEFHLDDQGKVAGATWAQFSTRIPLERR